MCGDYRPLNLVTPQDTYPMPIPKELFDSIGDSNIFIIVHMRQGFNQIELPRQWFHLDCVEICRILEIGDIFMWMLIYQYRCGITNFFGDSWRHWNFTNLISSIVSNVTWNLFEISMNPNIKLTHYLNWLFVTLNIVFQNFGVDILCLHLAFQTSIYLLLGVFGKYHFS